MSRKLSKNPWVRQSFRRSASQRVNQCQSVKSPPGTLLPMPVERVLLPHVLQTILAHKQLTPHHERGGGERRRGGQVRGGMAETYYSRSGSGTQNISEPGQPTHQPHTQEKNRERTRNIGTFEGNPCVPSVQAALSWPMFVEVTASPLLLIYDMPETSYIPKHAKSQTAGST